MHQDFQALFKALALHLYRGRGIIRRDTLRGYLRIFFVLRKVAVVLQVFLEVLALDLDGAAQPNAGYLPATYTLMDPALAHCQLLADLCHREQL